MCVTYECHRANSDLRIIVSIVDDNNAPILITQNADDPDNSHFYQLRPGLYRSYCVFPKNLFGERRFYISLRLEFPQVDQLELSKIMSFNVMFIGYNNIQYISHKDTFIRPRFIWRTEAVTTSEPMFAED